MPLRGATFPLFPYLLDCDLPLDAVFFCSYGRYRHIFRVIRRQAQPRPLTLRDIRRHWAPEPPMSVSMPVLFGNTFSVHSEESLYDSRLDLGLSVEALAAATPVPRARHHCLSALSILPVIDSTVSVIPSGLGAEVKPANQDQVTFPLIDSEPELDTLVSRAPKHLEQTFVKQSLSCKSTMPVPTPKPALNLGKEVAPIVLGLGIPC